MDTATIRPQEATDERLEIARSLLARLETEAEELRGRLEAIEPDSEAWNEFDDDLTGNLMRQDWLRKWIGARR